MSEDPKDWILPLKNIKPKPRRIIAFDTEDDSSGNVSLINFYDGIEHFTVELAEDRSNIREAMAYIYDQTDNPVFVAHNLEYDIANIFRDNWGLVDQLVYSSRLISIKLKGLKADFWDSFNWQASSLASMAKTIGREKGHYDIARLSCEENIKYCQEDCVILHEFVSLLQFRLNKDMKVNLQSTIARIAMDCYRRNFLKEPLFRYNEWKILEAYSGGRTEAFFMGPCENIHVADVRSMYPYVMQENLFPDPASIKEDPNFQFEYGHAKAKVNVPENMHVPPLPCKAHGKLWFPVGKFEGHWTYHEIRYAQSLGVKVEIQEAWGTDSGIDIFTTYIHSCYNNRLKAKSSGDEFQSLFYKILMNSLYGKFCQHSRRTALYTYPKNPEAMRLVDQLGPFYQYEDIDEAPAPTASFLIGTYVTSYARIYLHQWMKKVHDSGRTLLYCDTDSIFYSGEKFPFPYGDKLGEFSHEGTFTTGEFHALKGYLLYIDGVLDKVAAKGVPKELAEAFWNDGKATVKRPVKLRDKFRLNQEFEYNFWRETTKENQQLYIKRKGGNGPTKPVTFNEIEKQMRTLKIFQNKLDRKKEIY